MNLHLGCGKTIREGWVNVDHMPFPGVDVTCNLFQYPWQWQTSSVDEIFASHLIEHIPHEPKSSPSNIWPYSTPEFVTWRDRLMDLDGFFAFFAECWRVLVPGGTVECVAPFGQSRYAFQDPSHTRVILPGTVNYLTEPPGGGANFDYGLPFQFEQDEGKKGVMILYDGVSAALSYAPEPLQVYARDELERRLETLWNQAAELQFTLRAVK